MKEKGINFEAIKAKMIKEAVEGAVKWNSVKDIPRLQMFTLMERIQKKK